jgi:hypothetical protein
LLLRSKEDFIRALAVMQQFHYIDKADLISEPLKTEIEAKILEWASDEGGAHRLL